MRKFASLALVVLFVIFSTGCARQTAPRAGSATGESMLNLLPSDLNGVFLLDVHGAMTTPAAEKAMEDEETRRKYEEFVQEAGIDPMKDVYYVAIGIKLDSSKSEPETAAVVNLKYDKETLLAKLREQAKSMEEESYAGLTIYKVAVPDNPGENPCGAFLDGSNIVAGSESVVKAVIDVFQKKADSIRKSEAMAGMIKAADASALAWGAFAFPPEFIQKMTGGNAMLSSLEGVTGLIIAFDYKNKSAIMDLQTIGGTPENNKNLSDLLNGLKAMGGMAAAQEPALGDLLGRIEITSGVDFVKIHADVPQEIVNKLQETAKSKLGNIIQIEK